MAALLDVATLKAWIEPSLDSRHDAVLQRCLDAAEKWLERVSGRTIQQASFTRRFSGRFAAGSIRETLYLPAGHRPVIHSGGDLVTVSEDGTSLTVAVGYSDTAGVILSGVNEDRQAALIRNGTPWAATTFENISVTYKAGWTTASVPADVLQLEAEIAALLFRTPQFLGRASASKAGAAISFEKDLTPPSSLALAALRGY